MNWRKTGQLTSFQQEAVNQMTQFAVSVERIIDAPLSPLWQVYVNWNTTKTSIQRNPNLWTTPELLHIQSQKREEQSKYTTPYCTPLHREISISILTRIQHQPKQTKALWNHIVSYQRPITSFQLKQYNNGNNSDLSPEHQEKKREATRKSQQQKRTNTISFAFYVRQSSTPDIGTYGRPQVNQVSQNFPKIFEDNEALTDTLLQENSIFRPRLLYRTFQSENGVID